MGIKFRCPNGHKLNVKSFLAGKRGVCPDCQATFRIPEEPGGSDVRAMALPSLKGGNGAAVPESPDEPAMTTAAMPAAATTAVATRAAAVATAPVVAAPVAPAPKPAAPVITPAAPVTAVQPVAAMASAMTVGPGIPLATGTAVLPATTLAPGATTLAPGATTAAPGIATVTAPAAPAAGDPIAEAPAAVWYVRPPSGGQYGPARGDVFRKWISDGRVSSDSLVWREGWTDWRSAGQLFPTLGAPAAALVTPAAGPLIAGPAIPGPAAVPSTPRTTSRSAARKKSGNGMAISALVGLVLVCVVLVAVLVVVLTQQAA